MAHLREVARKTGIAYEVRWRDGAAFKQRTFTARREAERFALRVENTRADGLGTDALVRRSQTVAQVVEASLAASAPALKPSSFQSYRRIYDNRVLPTFGGRKVATVTRAEVQAWVIALAGAGLSPATVQHHYVALRKAMRYALHDRLIAHNPCDGVALPKDHARTDAERRYLTAAEVEALAAELDATPPYGLLVRFAAYTGLRAGEITGLRVRDLDLRAPHVEVRQTLQRLNGQWRVGTPKSARSTRTVPLLNRTVVAELREYLLIHPRSGEPDALLWPGRVVGSHALDWTGVLDVSSLRRNYLRPALRRAGLAEMRFHDLRHTFASLMLAAGFEPYKVSRWMGHSNLATTDSIYAHLYPTDHAADQDRLEALVGEVHARQAVVSGAATRD